MESQKTCLYRHYSAAGELLYVGISLDALSRLQTHMRFSGWRESIATVKIEWLDSLQLALAAERMAIETELPIWNVRHRKEAGIQGEATPQEIVSKIRPRRTREEKLLEKYGFPITEHNLMVVAQNEQAIISEHEARFSPFDIQKHQHMARLLIEDGEDPRDVRRRYPLSEGLPVLSMRDLRARGLFKGCEMPEPGSSENQPCSQRIAA